MHVDELLYSSNVSPREEMLRTLATVQQAAKDKVAANLVSAIKQGQIKVEAGSVDRLVSFVTASMDEGFSIGHAQLTKKLDKLIMARDVDESTRLVAKKK